jgi:hypothetical protein
MGVNYKVSRLRKTTAQGHGAIPFSGMLGPLGTFFNNRLLKGSAR